MISQRWQTRIDQTALAFAAACCGIVFFQALFPSFYYLSGIGTMLLLWVVVPLTAFFPTLCLVVTGTSEPVPARSNAPFIFRMLALLTLLVVCKAPLHASFLLARSGLEEAKQSPELVGMAPFDFGLYEIRKAERRCHKTDRLYFEFLNDNEAAIIHSPSGIDDLCYNSGFKGHLFGDWYWMKED